jgi:hypothetical protein
LVPPVGAHSPPHHGLAMTAAAGAGGVTVTVLPGGTVTVVPPGPGVTTVGGDALGAGAGAAGAGTMTVPGGCVWAYDGLATAATRPRTTRAAVIAERFIKVSLTRRGP